MGSGNLLVSVKALALVGVKSPIQLGAFYNSAAADQTADARLGNGWGLDLHPMGKRLLTSSSPAGTNSEIA